MHTHFIPLRRAEIVQQLAASGLTPEDQTAFHQLCELLASRFHYEFHRRQERLKDLYSRFDPDADTVCHFVPSAATLQLTSAEFFAEVIGLLERANYQRIPKESIEAALDTASDWGVKLDVDFDVFQRLEVFARGESVTQRTRRSLKWFFRSRKIELPIYRRLVIAFQLRDSEKDQPRGQDPPVFLKMFKDIPQVDLEMLLPGTRVKMSLVDHGRIFLPTLSGVAITIYKAIKGALALAFAGVYGVFAFLALVAGAIGYGVKSFLGYVRARDKYRLHMTQNLYYQNLDNNAGVFFRLLDEGEEQECREAILAYFVLWRCNDSSGLPADEIDDRTEDYLRDLFAMDIDFETADALKKLDRLRLVEKLGDRFRAVPISLAIERLDADWDNFFATATESPSRREAA